MRHFNRSHECSDTSALLLLIMSITFFCEIESHYSVDIYDKDDYQIPYKYLAEFFELHIIVIIVM